MSIANAVRNVLPQAAHDNLFRLSSPRVGDDLKHRYAAGLSMSWSLENLQRCGFRPETVIDAGAFIGDWTACARQIWPDARYLMVEPQPNKHARLLQMCGDMVSLETCLLGSTPCESVPFHVDDLGGSSVLEQLQDKCPQKCSLPMKTLDAVAEKHGLLGPILLKADVQGYELEVLRGAVATLPKVEAILLETSLLPYNVGAPLFAEVVAFLAERHFLLYDVCSMHRRAEDAAAFQVDTIFVRGDNALRSERKFFGA